MKLNRSRLTAEFAPEIRFELQPAVPLPFRATQETEFERLKADLLDEKLYLAGQPELYAPLRRAANEAAALAWATELPLLTFPVLFEEKAAAFARQARRQARILKNSSAQNGGQTREQNCELVAA